MQLVERDASACRDVVHRARSLAVLLRDRVIAVDWAELRDRRHNFLEVRAYLGHAREKVRLVAFDRLASRSHIVDQMLTARSAADAVAVSRKRRHICRLYLLRAPRK
jgi:hypothetical protein